MRSAASATTVTADRTSASPFASLSTPAYRDWFFAQILSASGNLTQGVAAAWVVLTMTHSGVALAGLGFTNVAPMLLGGAWAGLLLDRGDRRSILIATQCAFVVVNTALAALSLLGGLSLVLLYVLSAASGLVNAIDMPARQVYVLDLVGGTKLASAVSLYEIILSLARVVGPAIGGVLLATVGPGACFLFNALSFVPTLVVLLLHRAAHAPHPADRPQRERGAVAAGFRYAFGSPQLRSCLLLAVCGGMLFNTTVLFPLFATRTLHLGSAGFGLLVAAFGAGAFPGALFAARTHGEPSGGQVAGLAALTGSLTVLTALAATPVEAYLGAATIGFASIWFIASTNTLVQLRSAPQMRGRVMGIWTMALPGMSPVTGVLLGALADAVSARWAFIAAGLAMLLCATLCWRALKGGGEPVPSVGALNAA